MKRFIVIAFLLLITFFIPGCDDNVPRDSIISYVNDNYELLGKFPYHGIEDFDAQNAGFDNYVKRDDHENEVIKSYLGTCTIVRGVYACNEDVLAFYCGGTGQLP